MSDSVRVLVNKNYLFKEVDKQDNRTSYLLLTDQGKELVSKFNHFSDSLYNSVSNLKNENLELVFNSLVSIISELQESGNITERRMCSKCNFYEAIDDKMYHCHLMKKNLMKVEFRLDCPEFKKKK